ncbi:unnamed protein product [Ectocarpus sp. 12 AP-2014]
MRMFMSRWTLLPRLLLLLTPFLEKSGSAPITGTPRPVEPAHACADLASGQYTGSGWTFEDCLHVWNDFNAVLGTRWYPRMTDADLWSDTAEELRLAGSPCLVRTNPHGDGAGSTTIRHLMTWIFSREMGCDWVTPDWGKRFVGGYNGTAVMYCHKTSSPADMGVPTTKAERNVMTRCAVIDWLSYFQFDVPSVPSPVKEKLLVVEAKNRSFTQSIVELQTQLQQSDIKNQRWGRVVFSVDLMLATYHLVNVGSWDERKRNIVREVLQEARLNFHRYPRPWYDEKPRCQFEDDRFNFAVHVRMGDRRALYDGTLQYLHNVELIMENVTDEFRQREMPEPLFHVFSETLSPCPSTVTGLFDEFPTWPVELDQVEECLAATTPRDCAEKQARSSCIPKRSGIFRIRDKSFVLHVGSDVQNELSCMIQADGVVMGCSTFGQIAGLLTRGISFFSTRCGGERTAAQSKAIPPLAIAERGHLWVPIEGSWHDPVLSSTSIFRAALDTLVAAKGRR